MIAAGATSAASTISDDRDYHIAAVLTRPIQQKIYAAERPGRTCMSATCSGDYLLSCPRYAPVQRCRGGPHVDLGDWYAGPHVVPGDRYAGRHVELCDCRAGPGAAPFRQSGPRHLVPSAPRLAFPCQTPLLVPESKRLFDARSSLLQIFHAWPTSLGFFTGGERLSREAAPDREVSASAEPPA